MVRNYLLATLIFWITVWILLGEPWTFLFFFGSSYLGFTLGFFVLVFIIRSQKEAEEKGLSVVVQDRGVIAYGRDLLWEEIKELREDPWEGYQLIFRPSNDEGESLQCINLDDFHHFDHFVTQLQNHGVKINIRRPGIR